jgi:hypothetical protein
MRTDGYRIKKLCDYYKYHHRGNDIKSEASVKQLETKTAKELQQLGKEWQQ